MKAGAPVKNTSKADFTKAVVAICKLLFVGSAVGANGMPCNVGEITGALLLNALLIVVAKLGSLLSAVANSFNVSSAAGELFTNAAILAAIAWVIVCGSASDLLSASQWVLKAGNWVRHFAVNQVRF